MTIVRKYVACSICGGLKKTTLAEDYGDEVIQRNWQSNLCVYQPHPADSILPGLWAFLKRSRKREEVTAHNFPGSHFPDLSTIRGRLRSIADFPAQNSGADYLPLKKKIANYKNSVNESIDHYPLKKPHFAE
jgi:hypothetical protein